MRSFGVQNGKPSDSMWMAQAKQPPYQMCLTGVWHFGVFGCQTVWWRWFNFIIETFCIHLLPLWISLLGAGVERWILAMIVAVMHLAYMHNTITGRQNWIIQIRNGKSCSHFMSAANSFNFFPHPFIFFYSSIHCEWIHFCFGAFFVFLEIFARYCLWQASSWNGITLVNDTQHLFNIYPISYSLARSLSGAIHRFIWH